MILALAVLVALSVSLTAGEKAGSDGDVQVTLNDLPAAVKGTLLQAAGNGTIEEIEKEASGIYSADVVLDGKKIDIEIAADGTLIKTEADDEDEGAQAEEAGDDAEVVLTLNDVPAAVAAAIKQEAGSGTIDEIELDDEDGNVRYEAEITKDGKSVEIEVAPDGTVIKVEADDEEENEAGEVD